MKGIKGLVAAGLLLVGTAGWADVAPNDKEVLLGACHVLSGQSEAYGRETDVGINCVINTVNREGGIFGRKIRFITEDDRYEPDGAIAAFHHMQDKGAFAITGLVGSICLAKYLPLAERAKIPAVGFYPGPSFVSDPVKKYCFGARDSYRDEMRLMVDHLWNDVGIRRIGVIYQNDSFGADCLEGVKGALQKYKTEVVAAGSYTRNLNDINQAFETVKKADPQAVILACVYKPCTDIAKLAVASNWHPIFAVNSGTNADGFLDQAGKDAEGYLITEVAPPPTHMEIPLVRRYRQDLTDYYPKEKPNFVSLRGYIDATVVVEGLKAAGKDLTRDKFVDALEKLRNRNIGLGKGMDLTYTPADHLGFHNVFFCRIQNGQIESFQDWKKLKAKK